jgi:hypothetical protein
MLLPLHAGYVVMVVLNRVLQWGHILPSAAHTLLQRQTWSLRMFSIEQHNVPPLPPPPPFLLP